MRFNRVSLVLTVLLAAVLASCEPYEFQMSSAHPVAGQILSSLSTVEPGSSITTVGEDGEIRLSNFGVPEYSITTGIRLLHGQGAEILIHPRVEVNRIVDSGIVARITRHGASLQDRRSVLAERTDISLDTGQTVAVKILSEGHMLQVVVGCDTLYKGPSYHIESDDLVIRTLPSSAVDVIAPDWVPGLIR